MDTWPSGPRPVVVLVPVKPLSSAKSRLRGAHVDHAALVLALMHDTVSAALASEAVASVLVVSSDDRVLDHAGRAGAGACLTSTGSLNADLSVAADLARRRSGHATIAALPADLPALRARDLEAAIRAAGGRRSFVPDRQGSGTTLLLSGPGLPLDPRYGPGSGARHADSGALRLVGPWVSLAHDVDTPADLAAAASLPLGRRTRQLLGEQTSPATPPLPRRASDGHDNARTR